jgi:hypothetical protein
MSLVEAPARSIQVDRIIRTDLLADLIPTARASQSEPEDSPLINITIVWLPLRDASLSYDVVEQLFRYPFGDGHTLGDYYGPGDDDDDDYDEEFEQPVPGPYRLLSEVISYVRHPNHGDQNVEPEDLEYVPFFLSQQVVIERSPPYLVTLKDLLEGVKSVVSLDTESIGIFHVCEVSAGIIILGAAVGISIGLQKGLARAIENAIAGKKRASPRKQK